jgi:hypothetical protein
MTEQQPKDYGYLEKYEMVRGYSGMCRFIYPLMCPIYLTKHNLWDDRTTNTI